MAAVPPVCDFGWQAPDFTLKNTDGNMVSLSDVAGPTDLRRDLYEAMKQVAETGASPKDQIPSMGCSIKWKDA